jgi:signal transduction histidine kinase
VTEASDSLLVVRSMEVRHGTEIEARRVAGRLIGFLGHALVYGLGCLLLLITAGPFVALIVAVSWGIGLASHGFFAVAAPILRSRLEEGARSVLAPPALPASDPRTARSLEELSAAVAHEIRNPITAAKSLVQQIAEDPQSPDNAEYAAVAVGELDRVERSIVHLLRFAREETPELVEMRMIDVVQGAIETLRDRASTLGASLTTSLEDTGRMRGDAEKLRRVVENLIGNALDALEEGKTPSPRVEIASGSNLAGTEVWVAVRDNGPGIPESALPRMFDPFFTSKGSGTGFGLALSKKTIAAHGGTIEAQNRASGGAELLFTLPRDRARTRPGAGA